MNHSFANAIKTVSAFFKYADIGEPQQLPVFIGSEAERVDAWRALNARDCRFQWCKASIAANIVHANGHRTDRGKGPTAIQQFCREVRIGAVHCSRMARTYTECSRLLATGTKRSLPDLLADDRLCFKHFLVAFNYAALPVEALLEAQMFDLSANELARRIAERQRRTLIDGDSKPVTAADDDDDTQVTWQPTREEVRRAPTREVRLTLTPSEHREFASQVRALSAAFGTTDDAATIRAAVARAFDSLRQQAEETAA